jgi:tetratricopeptide (TPR) repeat protein
MEPSAKTPDDGTVESLAERFRSASTPSETFDLGLKLAGRLQSDFRLAEVSEVLLKVQPLAKGFEQEAAVHAGLGRCYSSQSQYEKAVFNYEQVIVKLSGQPDSLVLFNAYNALATIYYLQGYLEWAENFCHGGQMVLDQRAGQCGLEMDSARASMFHVRGLIGQALGRQEAAEEDYRKEVEMLKPHNVPGKLWAAYNNIGGICKSQGKIIEAIEAYRTALGLAEVSNRWGELVCHYNLGETDFNLGSDQQAVRHLEKSLEINRSVANRIWDVWCLTCLGKIRQSQERYPEAKEKYRAAQSIAAETGSKSGEARVLVELASLKLQQGDHSGAQESLDQAIRLNSQTGKDHGTRFQVLQASIWLEQARPAASGEKAGLIEQALLLLSKLALSPILVEDEDTIWPIELLLEMRMLEADLHLLNGNKTKAVVHIKEAAAAAEEFAGKFEPEQKASFLGKPQLRKIYALNKELEG